MPRLNIDYSNTIIYKLCCKDISITEIYIGHTTDMRKRKYCHKSDCNNENGRIYNLNVYKYIRENGGWDNWDMIEIERYNAIDGYNATKRERYWVDELKATLNGNIPSRTIKEYEEDRKEDRKEYKKIYNENNKAFIAENKKIFYEKNKEIINKKNKEYYENNKKIINEKITCECGCNISKCYLNRHKQSKKHIHLMSQNVSV